MDESRTRHSDARIIAATNTDLRRPAPVHHPECDAERKRLQAVLDAHHWRKMRELELIE